jgi:hypothetical protein
MRTCYVAALSLLALGAVGSNAGCKKKPELPATMLYQVRSKDLSLVGSTLSVRGHQAKFEKRPWNSTEDVAQADVSVERNGPSALDELSLEFPTPCGVKKIALKAKETKGDEDKARMYSGPFGVDLSKLDDDTQLPAGVDVWLDGSAEDKVSIGKVDLAPGKTRLFDPTCKDSLSVTAGGKELGPFTVDGATTSKSVFVTTKKNVCYSLELVSYGAGAQSYQTILRGSQVYAISADDIQYFLKTAPSSKQGITSVYELVTTPCDK